MTNKTNDFNTYDTKVHRYGRLLSLILVIVLACVPVALQLGTGTEVDFGTIIKAAIPALATFVPVAIIEFLSYPPILGAGGQYLAFITGNVMNMKIPASTSGLKLAKVNPGTPEADVVSVISIAISSIVTTAILFVGMILAAQLLPLLQTPTFQPAFDNIMPAILGALATPMILKDLKTASVPCIIGALLTIWKGYDWVSGYQTFLLPVFLLIALGWAYFLYKGKAAK